MGIFGWDLPPGCSINDIPGNRPEDLAQEEMELAFYDNKPDKNGRKRFTDAEWKYLGSKHRTGHLEDIIMKAIEYGIGVGHEQAKAEDEDEAYCEAQAKEYNEQKAFEEYYERATGQRYPYWWEEWA